MTTCINLMERFSQRYRISFDQADDRQRREMTRSSSRYPADGGSSSPTGRYPRVEIDGHQLIVDQLKRLACCRIHQLGDGCATFLFDVADFAKVAGVVLPHRKPQLTEAQKAESVERLKRWQFQAAATPQTFEVNRGVKSPV